MEQTDRIEEAYQEWLRLQNRDQHPEGKFDNGGRWYPSSEEQQECCGAIRSPSRAHPYSYLVHCRSLEHVAHRYGIPAKALRSRKAQDNKPAQREGGIYYKLVALSEDGFFRSIYDGETVYQIGEELYEPAHQNHGGGFYVHRTEREALSAQFPKDSALLTAPVGVLTVECRGNYCVYDNGKLSFSRLTPLSVEPVFCEKCRKPLTIEHIRHHRMVAYNELLDQDETIRWGEVKCLDCGANYKI